MKILELILSKMVSLDDVVNEYFAEHNCRKHIPVRVIVRQHAQEPFWNDIFKRTFDNEALQIRQEHNAFSHAGIRSHEELWNRIRIKFGYISYDDVAICGRAHQLAQEGKSFKFCEHCNLPMKK